ncbi:MAG: hypothetical protein M1829_004454 [Trizodia sp. TS-e1964]|nr:MAG: hypothetical protein M1829_004454 [Trizodia sp. TS-e1964]
MAEPSALKIEEGPLTPAPVQRAAYSQQTWTAIFLELILPVLVLQLVIFSFYMGMHLYLFCKEHLEAKRRSNVFMRTNFPVVELSRLSVSADSASGLTRRTISLIATSLLALLNFIQGVLAMLALYFALALYMGFNKPAEVPETPGQMLADQRICSATSQAGIGLSAIFVVLLVAMLTAVKLRVELLKVESLDSREGAPSEKVYGHSSPLMMQLLCTAFLDLTWLFIILFEFWPMARGLDGKGGLRALIIADGKWGIEPYLEGLPAMLFLAMFVGSLSLYCFFESFVHLYRIWKQARQAKQQGRCQLETGTLRTRRNRMQRARQYQQQEEQQAGTHDQRQNLSLIGFGNADIELVNMRPGNIRLSIQRRQEADEGPKALPPTRRR